MNLLCLPASRRAVPPGETLRRLDLLPAPRAIPDPAAAAEAYRQFPHLGNVLPALGYSEQQRVELAETIERSGADVVVDASPCRLDRLVKLSLPMVRVSYRFEQLSGPAVVDSVMQRLECASS